MPKLKVVSPFSPAGDQGQAIEKLTAGIRKGLTYQTLKGVTGSGKTYTMARIIEEIQQPTLIVSHNKTLAAQLYREFKDFFPDNAVEYFVSYYDYYQPEAYVPGKDLYIAKDASINQEIDRLRLSTTTSLIERRDVIVVATVSCIYGAGSPKDYRDMRIEFRQGQRLDVKRVAQDLVRLQFERNDAVLERSRFRLRGDVLEIFPAYSKEAIRIELSFDDVESIKRINPLTGEVLEKIEFCTIYPAKYFVMAENTVQNAMEAIRKELSDRYAELTAARKVVEAERLKSRTEYDLEMMAELGYCSGIENYSRHLAGRKPGERPSVLIDFFPNEFLTFVDESHVTLPQLRGMYAGDRSRKLSLVDYGFRLPSALDNRPLFINEFESMLHSTVFVSATPTAEEIEKSAAVVEQIIRPTGLLDPELEIRSSVGQIEDIFREINLRIAQKERTLITTLTKKMAEDLTTYLGELGLKVAYLHSEIETFERVEIIKALRTGDFDVLVGINLLREGLDMPEVSLIAILDADKIGFLRSATSLIQTIGRAARNVNGKVIMYADRISDAMKQAIAETDRRRKIQDAYNKEHGITPTTIIKQVQDILIRKKEEARNAEVMNVEILKQSYNLLVPKQRNELIKTLQKEMLELAKNLEFEKAAVIRDEIEKIRNME